MFSVNIHSHQLLFKKLAATSRGALLDRQIYYIELTDGTHQSWGEAGTLPGLSLDDMPDYPLHVYQLQEKAGLISDLLMRNASFREMEEILQLHNLPSLSFALESAVLGWHQQIPHQIYNTAFIQENAAIPINGLVWMDTREAMLQQAEEKIQEGFSCVKLKIGALDFDEECRLLEVIRKKYTAFQLELRVDANGAFDPDTALEKLRELQRFDLHSIEQPVKKGQWDLMEEICAKSKVPVALDEELIGITPGSSGVALLEKTKPAYLVLKPSLLGGFTRCNQWIHAAQRYGIGYWITSALESNIGLNAIAQYTSTRPVHIPQGLGTGQLYINNIPSPLTIRQGGLYYSNEKSWDFSLFLSNTNS